MSIICGSEIIGAGGLCPRNQVFDQLVLINGGDALARLL